SWLMSAQKNVRREELNSPRASPGGQGVVAFLSNLQPLGSNLRLLEEEVQPELNQPRVHARRRYEIARGESKVPDILEPNRAKVGALRRRELRVVEGIVEVAPKLHSDPLRDLRVLHDGDVPVELTRPGGDTDGRVAVIGRSPIAKRYDRQGAAAAT